MIPRRAFIRPLQVSNGAWVKAVVNGAWCWCYNMSATFHFWNWECEIKNQNEACGCIIRSSGGSTSSTWPNACSERIISYVVDTHFNSEVGVPGERPLLVEFFYSLIIIIICGHLTMMNLCTWYASQGAAVRCAICSGRATRGIYNWCVVVDRKSCWGVFCYGWWMCQGNARNIKNIEIHRSVVFAVPLSILHEQSHHQEVANLIVPPIHTHVVHAFCLAFLALKHVQICLVSSMYLSWRSGARRITNWWSLKSTNWGLFPLWFTLWLRLPLAMCCIK